MAANMATVINTEIFSKLGEQLQQLRRPNLLRVLSNASEQYKFRAKKEMKVLFRGSRPNSRRRFQAGDHLVFGKDLGKLCAVLSTLTWGNYYALCVPPVTNTIRNLKGETSLVKLSFSNVRNFPVIRICEFITRNKTLNYLSLHKCDVSDAVIKDLAEALKSNTTLTELNLSANYCRLGGALELSLMLKENKTLRTLDLSHNEIGLLGIMLIIAASTHNEETPDINSMTKNNNDEGLTRLVLQNVCSYRITAITEKLIWRWLCCGSSITELDMGGNNFGNVFLCELDETKIIETDSGGKQLRKLNLSRTTMRNDNAIGLLGFFCTSDCIEELDLGFNQLTDNAMDAVSYLLTITTSLTSLNLSHNRITDKGVKVLAKALEKNRTLNCLNLSYTAEMTDVGVAALCEALKYNNSQEKLNLLGISVTEKSCGYFKDAFHMNTTLTKLKLSSCGSERIDNAILNLQLQYEGRHISMIDEEREY